MQIRPYLTFKGECRDAITLYTKAFNTQATQVALFSDMPSDPNYPMQIDDAQKDWVLQAIIPLGNNLLRLSDCLGELNDDPTERIAIVVECSVDEVKHAFQVISEEGRVGIPLQETFFSPCHGVVFDKFGVMWNFVAEQ